MIYYIADLHIGHKNAIRFDDRPFRDVKQMEKTILNNWNNKVLPNDDVYILGDVFYHYPDNKKTVPYESQWAAAFNNRKS